MFLTYLFDLITGNMAKGPYTGMIMLDLQKDIFSVEHESSCRVLKGIGIRYIEYLWNRKQFVQ